MDWRCWGARVGGKVTSPRPRLMAGIRCAEGSSPPYIYIPATPLRLLLVAATTVWRWCGSEGVLPALWRWSPVSTGDRRRRNSYLLLSRPNRLGTWSVWNRGTTVPRCLLLRPGSERRWLRTRPWWPVPKASSFLPPRRPWGGGL